MARCWIFLVLLAVTMQAELVATDVELGGNDCSSSTDTCMAINGQICSNHGVCRCGRCECQIVEGIRYSGKYCEKCLTCPGTCSLIKDCVECQMYKKGLLKDPLDCEKNCTSFVPSPVEAVKNNEDVDEHLCTFYDEDECRYQFVYRQSATEEGTTTLHVRAQQHPKCPRTGRVPHRY